MKPAPLIRIETFRERHPNRAQLACLDAPFHRSMPRVAKLLPIPRRCDAQGVQRYGFHGLSYTDLMEKRQRLGDPAVSKGRVILGHLGNGASRATVRGIRTDEERMFARSVLRSGAPIFTEGT